MSCSQGAVTTLIVALVVGVQGHQIIYVDTENGTLNNSCWEGGLDQPCGSLELATTGAKRYNSTIAVVLRQGTSCTAAWTSLQALSYPPSPTTKNDTCRCNELGNTQKMIQYQFSQVLHLALLGSNHPMALANVGRVSMMLSSVMKHYKNLPYFNPIA